MTGQVGTTDLTEWVLGMFQTQGAQLTTSIDYFAKHASSAPAQSFMNAVDKVWAQESNAKEDSKSFSVETPELVARALEEMDREIKSNKIDNQEKRAHIRAIELHHQHGHRQECCYVCTEYFRLRFLRAERFNPPKAAIRYCHSLKIGRAHV